MSVNPTEGAPLNPWRSIWTRPRETIQRIVETDPKSQVIAIAAFIGVVNVTLRAISEHLGDQSSLAQIIGVVLFGGLISGVIGLYLGALLLQWTGSWIGGRASTSSLRAALAWGGAPYVIGGTLLIPAVLIAGKSLFMTNREYLTQRPGVAPQVLALILAQFLTMAWSCVTTLKSIGQVQGFSAWRALGNVALGFLVAFLTLLAAVFAVALLKR